jgi:hypothetical protein
LPTDVIEIESAKFRLVVVVAVPVVVLILYNLGVNSLTDRTSPKARVPDVDRDIVGRRPGLSPTRGSACEHANRSLTVTALTGRAARVSERFLAGDSLAA